MTLTAIAAKDGALDSKVCEAEFSDGIIVSVRYVSPLSLQVLLNGCKVQKYNVKTRAHESAVDEEKFNSAFARSFVSGWRGLTPRRLLGKMALNVDSIPSDGWDTEIPYSQEDAVHLIKNLPGFDLFVQSAGTNVANFQTIPEGTGPNSSASPNGV